LKSYPDKTYIIIYEPIFKENLALLQKNNIHIQVLFCNYVSTKNSFYMITWDKDYEQAIIHFKKNRLNLDRMDENALVYEKYDPDIHSSYKL
jgi:hypothetical protein